MIVREYRPNFIDSDEVLREQHVDHAADALHISWVKAKGGIKLVDDEFIMDANGYVIAIVRPASSA